MPTWIQWVSFGLAIIGSISGVWALVLNQQRTTILRRKEKERLEAKKKAKFQINRIREMGNKRLQDKFVIINVGEAEARNIKVEFYCYNRFKGNVKMKVNALHDNVPSTILSGQTSKLLMMIAGGSAPPWDVIITWEDDFEENNKVEITLN